MEPSAFSTSSFENPCELVRKTCRTWMEDEGLLKASGDNNSSTADEEWNRSCKEPTGRRSVKIRLDKLDALAKDILAQNERVTKESAVSRDGADSSEAKTKTQTTSSWIEWDSEGWHYGSNGMVGFNGSEAEKRERIALYLLALDAINFCFWPWPEHYDNNHDTEMNTKSSKNNLLEYEDLAMAMTKMAELDHNTDNSEYVFAPQNLASMTVEKMTSLFEVCKYPLPNIEKRCKLWNEVGESLLANFNGSASAMLDASDGVASKLVELVATSFPGFRDEVVLPPSSPCSELEQSQRIVFLKRAQIFVGDINAALGLELTGMHRLTTFADYRVPQILRHWGILDYAPCLSSRVDNEIDIEQGSCDEISIRASTVVAVEELVKLLNIETQRTNCGAKSDGSKYTHTIDAFTDVAVDWYLWQVGERMHQEGSMKPFHKVRTHFY